MVWFVGLTSYSSQAANTILYDGETGFARFPFGVGLGASNTRWLGYGEVPFKFSGFSAQGVGTPSLNTDLGFGFEGYAGYSNYTLTISPNPSFVLVNPDFPTLDRVAGFSINFNVAVTNESSNANRAGFSVLVVSDDGKSIELGLKQESGRIFAQSENFIEAEEVGFDIGALTDYALTIQDDHYALVADGVSILTGKLRHYNFDPTASSPPLPFNPYTSPNFLFFGDDTDQGDAAFTLGPISVNTAEEGCQVYDYKYYALHDGGLNNSQFLTIDPISSAPAVYSTTPLGPIHEGHDIEALDMNPHTSELYAASGDDPSADHPNGYLYRVDTSTGGLTPIGSTGFGEVSAISFRADGSLWGWADGEGLLEIDASAGAAKLLFPSNAAAIEGLTWNQASNTLYGSDNTKLWAWDGTDLTMRCNNLPGQTEALDMLSLPSGDELLLFATHFAGDVSIHAWDIKNCQPVANIEIDTPYNDIEAITWKLVCG